MKRLLIALVIAVPLAVIATALFWARSSNIREAPPMQASPASAGKAIPAAAASPADDGNWTMPGKDYASTRFSGLNEITPANVGKLQVTMTFSTGTTEGFEAPPLVVGGTMYVITPFPNDVFALDLTKPGAPAKWVFKPKPLAAAQGVACCDVVNRGAVYSNGRHLLQHARRPDDRGRRRQRPAGVADPARQHPEGRDDHHGAAGRRGQSAGRQFGRRDGRARLARRARRRQRQARLEGLQHRPRQGRADRPALQALLRHGPGQGPRRQDLAARRVEDRRRHRLGLAQLRSRART